MQCSFCKEEIQETASVCSYCNAFKTTNGANRFNNSSSIASVGIFFSMWACSVGLIWFIVLFVAFGPIYFTAVEKKSIFFQTTSWDCRFNYDRAIHNNKKYPSDESLKRMEWTRRFENGQPVYVHRGWGSLSSMQTKEFRNIRDLLNGHFTKSAAPICDSTANKTLVSERIETMTKADHDVGNKATYENILIKEAEVKNIEMSAVTFFDYLIGVLISILVLIIGLPIAKFATKIWNAIFQSDKVIWVRR